MTAVGRREEIQPQLRLGGSQIPVQTSRASAEAALAEDEEVAGLEVAVEGPEVEASDRVGPVMEMAKKVHQKAADSSEMEVVLAEESLMVALAMAKEVASGEEAAVAEGLIGLAMVKVGDLVAGEGVVEDLTSLKMGVMVVMEVVDLEAGEEVVEGLTSLKMEVMVVMEVDLEAGEVVEGLTSLKMGVMVVKEEVDLVAGEEVVEGLTSLKMGVMEVVDLVAGEVVEGLTSLKMEVMEVDLEAGEEVVEGLTSLKMGVMEVDLVAEEVVEGLVGQVMEKAEMGKGRMAEKAVEDLAKKQMGER